ncbi:MAG: long-chain fatty acid--CoA ligase [Chloroflexota bacterium]|nr:long-chain fatty acid--CoA ligase [Chloroflexota bacterium]
MVEASVRDYAQAHFAFWPARLPHSLTLPRTSVYHNLEVTAERYPDKTAISYYGAAVSYRRLREEAERLAGFLERELGVRKGDRVLLYLQNSPQFIVAFYAILRANAVVVPLNPMYVSEELRYYAADTGAKVAVVGQERWAQVRPLLADGESPLERVVLAAYSDYLGAPPGDDVPEVVAAPRQEPDDPRAALWSRALAAAPTPGPPAVGPDDLAVLPYTSGTTGEPKGCMHTHRTVQATLVGAAVWGQLTPDATHLVTLPLFHVTGLQHGMNAPIFSGGTMVLLTRWDRRLAGALIERHRCTHWKNISTMVVDFLAEPRVRDHDLRSLVSVGGGGASLPAAVGDALYELTGLRYVEGYGLTETISQTHANPPDRPKPGCLGIPGFDVDARVLDGETGAELGPGATGEIVVHGPQVLKGYWNKPDETAAAFVTIEGTPFFRTGDLGYRDAEGYFFMVDRLKRMINASGFKVWPAEVEAALYRHPAVQEACVVGAPDPHRGETAKAFVVLRETARGRIGAEEIIAWARGQMAAYKYPRSVEFVDALPRSASGKILWRRLQEEERARMQPER